MPRPIGASRNSKAAESWKTDVIRRNENAFRIIMQIHHIRDTIGRAFVKAGHWNNYVWKICKVNSIFAITIVSGLGNFEKAIFVLLVESAGIERDWNCLFRSIIYVEHRFLGCNFPLEKAWKRAWHVRALCVEYTYDSPFNSWRQMK